MNLAWAAGLFEGEGTIYLQRVNYRDKAYVYPRVALSMTDEDVVRAFCDAVGRGRVHGPYRQKGARKNIWQWSAFNNDACLVLDDLLPWLGNRRRAKAMQVVRAVGNMK